MEALHCIRTRRSVPRLVEPSPDEADLEALLLAAVSAPDHAQLRPWRFVVFTGRGRDRLGAVFATAHAIREPDADDGALEKTAAKPLRAPMIIAVVCTPRSTLEAWNGKDIPVWEQEAATAAAAQNLCLAAHDRGFGAMWRTGWYGDAPAVREALALGESDRVVGWIYLGTTPSSFSPAPRRSTDLAAAVTRWT